MKSYKNSIAALLTFFFFSHAIAQTEEEGVRQTVNLLFNGMRVSDTAMIRQSFAANGILQTISKNKEGKVMVRTEPIDSFLHSIARPHNEIYDEQIVFETIKIDGELASVWTPYKFYIGKTFSHCGVNSFQLVKMMGQWKIQYIIDTRRRQNCEEKKQ